MGGKAQCGLAVAWDWHELLDERNPIYDLQVEYWGCVPGALCGCAWWSWHGSEGPVGVRCPGRMLFSVRARHPSQRTSLIVVPWWMLSPAEAGCRWWGSYVWPRVGMMSMILRERWIWGIEQRCGGHPQWVSSRSSTMVGDHPLAYRTGGVLSQVVLNVRRAEWQRNRRMEFWHRGRLEEGWGRKEAVVGWVRDRSELR